MIRDLTDAFRKTAPAANQKFDRKSQIETSCCQGSPAPKVKNHASSGYATVLPNVRKVCTVNVKMIE